jgi:hypothetical protein
MVDCKHTPSGIEQIIPATSWVALFEGDEESPDIRPIVCWALIDCALCGERLVVPFVSDEGVLVSATSLDGYSDVAVESDVLDDIFDDGDAEGDAPS